MREQTLAKQYPTKSDYCNQQVRFFYPSFFKYKRYFQYFFLPEDTQITIETIKSQQKQDPVLQKVYHCLKTNKRPLQIDPTIASNSLISVYYKLYQSTVHQPLECTGKPYLLKAQLCAFNILVSTTIPLTVQNWQITS